MKRSHLVVIIPLLFVVTNTALAGARVGNHSNPYAGVALQESLDDFGTGFKLYGGYEFMDFDMGSHLVYVSGEVAYLDFGKHNNVSANGLSATANARMRVQDKLDVYARVGLAHTKVDVDNCVPGICYKANGSKVGVTIGGGARYKLKNDFALFAGVDHYDTEGGNENEISLGGEIRF